VIPPRTEGVIQPGEYGPGVDVDFTPNSRFGALLPDMEDPALSKSPADLSVRLHAAYSYRALFLAFRVRDQFVYAQEANRERPPMNDCVEIYLDGDRVANDFSPTSDSLERSREGFQLLVDAVGHQMAVPAALSNSGWRAATNRTSDGYVVEYEVPLTLIDVQDGPRTVPAGPGALINFGLAIDDFDSNVSPKRSFAYLRARPDVASPFRGGESSWSLGIRLAPKARE